MSTRPERWGLGLGLLALLSGPARAAPPSLLFVRGAAEEARVLRWSADAGTQPLGAGGPGWLAGPPSPDGRTAVVIQVRDTTQQLLLVDVQSGVARALGPPAHRLRQPSWTPDGAAVVVERAGETAPQIWLHPVEGGPGRALTDHPTGAFDGRISPDGRTLAFVAHDSGSLELWRRAVAGGPPRRLVSAPGDELQPTWSPDGTRLAFFAERDGRVAVHSIGVDGTRERTTWRPAPQSGERLVPDQGIAWSPLGDALALVVRRPDGRPDVRLIDAQRGRMIADASGLATAETPSWLTDGSGVVLAGREGDRTGLFTLSRSGTLSALPTGPGWLPRVLQHEPTSP